MGANDPIQCRDALHLLRRAAFGGTPKDVDRVPNYTQEDVRVMARACIREVRRGSTCITSFKAGSIPTLARDLPIRAEPTRISWTACPAP
jgi:hypothetical protein